MKKQIIGAVTALSLSVPFAVSADTVLGFSAGAGTWTHKPSGSVTSSVGGSGSAADLTNTLQLDTKGEGYTYFTLEHPVPVLPNVKFMNTKLTATGTVNGSFDFNGTTYNSSEATTMDLTQTDIILYYELLDNVVSLDVGINGKTINGKVAVNTDESPIKATIPLVYVSAGIELPAGFGLSAELSSLSVGNNKISDSSVKITYTTDFYLGVEAGVRNQEYTVDISSVVGSMKFSGSYIGVYFKF